MDCREPAPSTPPAHLAGFVACSVLDPIDAPFLAATEPDGGRYDLSWNTLPDTLDELQEATQPDFSDAATISITGSGKLAFLARPSGDYFYRVRRLRGSQTSEWSNGVGVRVAGTSGFVAFDDNGDDDPHLVEIHQAHAAPVRGAGGHGGPALAAAAL